MLFVVGMTGSRANVTRIVWLPFEQRGGANGRVSGVNGPVLAPGHPDIRVTAITAKKKPAILVVPLSVDVCFVETIMFLPSKSVVAKGMFPVMRNET
jgi:hypothetical protein